MNNLNGLNFILRELVHRYRQRVPDVDVILRAMIDEGLIKDADEIENDHIAFRTLGVPNLGVDSLEKIFLHYSYTKVDHYFFPKKKLDAWWYAPPAEGLPRIFISELRVQDLSLRAEKVIRFYTDSIKVDPVKLLDLDDPVEVDLFLHSSLWRLPSLDDYNFLASESEYAAWAIYNRYYLNHFTIAVHNLKLYNTIESFTAFLESKGIIMNDAGGKIKVSADGGLLQSSTAAQMVKGEFAFGKEKMIPGSYVEFAERKMLNGKRREGFEAANADKIFESTYLEQTGKGGVIS